MAKERNVLKRRKKEALSGEGAWGVVVGGKQERMPVSNCGFRIDHPAAAAL